MFCRLYQDGTREGQQIQSAKRIQIFAVRYHSIAKDILSTRLIRLRTAAMSICTLDSEESEVGFWCALSYWYFCRSHCHVVLSIYMTHQQFPKTVPKIELFCCQSKVSETCDLPFQSRFHPLLSGLIILFSIILKFHTEIVPRPSRHDSESRSLQCTKLPTSLK
jgi:hypothetical protein